MIIEEEFSKKISQVKNLIRNNKLPEAKEICLNIKDYSKKDQSLIHTLMGNDVALRKDFIVSNAINVRNLDI